MTRLNLTTFKLIQDTARGGLFKTLRLVSSDDHMRELMQRGSILEVLQEKILERGFVGSADLPKLLFLTFYTALFDQPVSMVIKGSSGAGKSFALKTALQFIPRTAYEQFSGMSERALVYTPGLKLKHKHLVIHEAAGLTDGPGRVFLRQLLSEGEVRYQTVQKTQDGMVGKELPRLEGPTGLIMTTTAAQLHREDESRMLSYQLDENPEKMHAALVMQAMMQGKPAKPLDTKPWFALHQYIKSHGTEVVAPFLMALAEQLPRTHNRVMRDFPHIISLIHAHALLHQWSRNRDAQGAVIATVDDYIAVRDLIEGTLSEGLDVSVPPNVREVVEAVARLLLEKGPKRPFDNDQGVSQRQVADLLHRDPSVISRNVGTAVHHGFLANQSPGQGRQATLVMGERELPSGSVLPDPRKLFGELEGEAPPSKYPDGGQVAIDLLRDERLVRPALSARDLR